MVSVIAQRAIALPPPQDIPEEILREEIITEARSPLDGKPLTASEYAELEQKIAQSDYPPELSPEIQQLVFLLKLRKLFLIVTPF